MEWVDLCYDFYGSWNIKFECMIDTLTLHSKSRQLRCSGMYAKRLGKSKMCFLRINLMKEKCINNLPSTAR